MYTEIIKHRLDCNKVKLDSPVEVSAKGGTAASSTPFSGTGAALLPDGIRDGDVLTEQGGGYQIDRAATQKRKEEMDAKRRRLFGK